MPTTEELLAKVASYADQIVEAQRQLTAIPALGPENGGQGELPKAMLIQKWLEEMGLEVVRVDAPDQRVESGLRPNLLTWLPGEQGPAVWVLSHLDVVPPGSLELWSGDPWTLRVEDGRLYGRGVLDNQAGIVSSLFGLKALVELEISPPGPAGLILVSDEETGSEYGVGHVLSTREDFFSPQDLIVVPDGGEPDASLIEVAEKSILWLKAEVRGKQTHASTPHKGKNALYGSARMIVAIKEVSQAFPQVDSLFTLPQSSFEPTRKDAGVGNINTIPGRDVFFIDCRILPQIPLEEVQQAFKDRFEAIAKEEGLEVELTTVMSLQAPPKTPADAEVVKALTSAISRVHGVQPRAGGIGGGTEAAFFRERGLPAAVWMTSHDTAHAPDEWCLLDDLIKDAQVFALLFAGPRTAA
jgi:succinyl-diaminopimelate desuccinylase